MVIKVVLRACRQEMQHSQVAQTCLESIVRQDPSRLEPIMQGLAEIFHVNIEDG